MNIFNAVNLRTPHYSLNSPEPPVRREGSEGSVFEELLEGERGVVFRPSYVTM